MTIEERIAGGPRPIIADGAIGTQLLNRHHQLATGPGQLPCVEHLNLSSAELVMAVHRDYLKAGAELVVTNSFCATAGHLQAHDPESKADRINTAAATLARTALTEAGTASSYVLGSCGPTQSPEKARRHYQQQMLALRAGGVDCLLIETVRSAGGLEAALLGAADVAAELGSALPLLVAFCPTDDSLTLSDGSLGDLVMIIQGHPVVAIGVNCGDGDRQVYRSLAAIRDVYDGPLLAMPSAGLPRSVGGRIQYPLTPDEWAARVFSWHAELSLAIAGGCCGTTPRHIETLKRVFEASSS